MSFSPSCCFAQARKLVLPTARILNRQEVLKNVIKVFRNYIPQGEKSKRKWSKRTFSKVERDHIGH